MALQIRSSGNVYCGIVGIAIWSRDLTLVQGQQIYGCHVQTYVTLMEM